MTIAAVLIGTGIFLGGFFLIDHFINRDHRKKLKEGIDE
jgi:hypothetical protein